MLRRPPRRGAATVEFAVVIPVFFVFILAMIEFGRGLMVTNSLQNAARAACRFGVPGGVSTSEIKDAATTALANQGVNHVSITVQVQGSTSTDAKDAVSNDRITVIVSAPIASNTWLPGANFVKGSLSGRFTLPRE